MTSSNAVTTAPLVILLSLATVNFASLKSFNASYTGWAQKTGPQTQCHSVKS